MEANDNSELLKKLFDTLESAYRQSVKNVQKLDSIRSGASNFNRPFIDPSLSAGNLLFELGKRNN